MHSLVLRRIVPYLVAVSFSSCTKDETSLSSSSPPAKETATDSGFVIRHEYIELEKIDRISKFRSGIGHDYSMLDLTLTVSPQGRVLKAVPSGGKEVLACWPQLRSEVMQWRFQPFAADGKAVTAVVKDLEEEIDWLAESRRWIYGPGGNSPRPR